MENKLWKVIWKRSGAQYSMCLADFPKINVTAKSLEDAIEMLEELVANEMHDPVPHFEYVNALPSAAGSPYIYTLTGHNCADGITNINDLFNRNKCPKCKNYPGQRTNEPIRAKSFPDDDLMFTDYLGEIISQRLASFLELQDCPELELRPITLNGNSTSEFFELISRHPREYVAIQGKKANKGGFKCVECGFVVWMYMPYEADYFKYVTAECLPPLDVRAYPIGVDYRMGLAVNKSARDSIIRS